MTNKTTSAPKKAARKRPAKPGAKPMGRPKLQHPKTTISFRIPDEVGEAFAILAEKDTKAAPVGTPRIVVSALYSQAFADYLKKRGVKIPAEVW